VFRRPEKNRKKKDIYFERREIKRKKKREGWGNCEKSELRDEGAGNIPRVAGGWGDERGEQTGGGRWGRGGNWGKIFNCRQEATRSALDFLPYKKGLSLYRIIAMGGEGFWAMKHYVRFGSRKEINQGRNPAAILRGKDFRCEGWVIKRKVCEVRGRDLIPSQS